MILFMILRTSVMLGVFNEYCIKCTLFVVYTKCVWSVPGIHTEHPCTLEASCIANLNDV